jgi:hypothetical protein
VVRRGKNELRPGIAAVAARTENGELKILAGKCPQLLAEAELYRYADDAPDGRAEAPVDEHNQFGDWIGSCCFHSRFRNCRTCLLAEGRTWECLRPLWEISRVESLVPVFQTLESAEEYR